MADCHEDVKNELKHSTICWWSTKDMERYRLIQD